MTEGMFESLLLGMAFVASCAGTGIVRVYALKRQLLDVPGERSSHTRPTPLGGGLAIAAMFLCAIVFLRAIDAMPIAPFMALFGGGAAVAAVGFWDDHTPVPACLRIVAHFIAGAWALYWLGGLPALSADHHLWDLGWAGDLAGLLAIVWLLNLYNFMDGIDGMVGIEAVTVSATACLIMAAGKPDASLLWLGLLGTTTLGFLPWNWPPARIFMGDVGSGFVGFILAILALYTLHKGALTLWTWAILQGVFIVDATVTLLRRIIRREEWYRAHRSHAYQHAAVRWNSHLTVTLAVLAINILWLAPLAWFVDKHPRWGLFATCVALMPLVCAALMLNAGRPE
jgi:Fuc2NAc and GlcNAc transferase